MARRPVCYVTAPSWPARSPAEGGEAASALAPLGEALGFAVRLSPMLDAAYAGHGAWSDPAVRLADLRRALRHELVWALRGGFGCIQLLPGALRLPARGRPGFAGFSDNTVLHALWWRRGWDEAFYSRMPPRQPSGRHLASLAPLLAGKAIACDAVAHPGVRALADGEAEGRLFVACLSVLASLAGTPLQPDLRGAILCIEDIDEKPYAVEMALNQLHLAGVLRGVRGIAAGFFTYAERSDYSGPHIDAVLAAWARRLRVPAVDRLPFGHIDDHLVLPTGRQARLAVKAGRWSLELAARPRPPWVAT